VRGVFLRILGFVLLIDLFYMGIGQFYLVQSEEHPPPELTITVETDTDTLVGMGETLVAAKGGCLLCHKITEVGNTRGPDLRGVGGRAGVRKPGMSAEAYLTESLVDPGAYVVEGFATAGGESIMPAADKPPADMSPTELKALVAFLQSLGGEITVEITAEDVKAAEARKQKPAETTASTHPGSALLTAKGCVACHDVTGTTRRVGPPLSSVGERLSAAAIRQSIIDPDAVIADGFQQGLMLQDFAEQLTPEELDQIVGFLSGEVSLGERLAHPGLQLLALILLFNGGVALAMRALESASGGAVRDAPERTRSNTRYWIAAALLAATVGLYLALSDRETESPPAPAPAPERSAAPETAPAPAADGRALYMQTCVACHGPEAKGIPGLGKDMTTSEFIQSKSDLELVEFIKKGRGTDDPLNTTGVPMPPNGANDALTDADILVIVEFIRSLSK
jgi:disulfide bond formation protein DsbB